MKVLEDAFQLRNKKINKIELLKQEEKVLDFWNNFENICNSDYANLSEIHEKHLLKCLGIYDKGDANSSNSDNNQIIETPKTRESYIRDLRTSFNNNITFSYNCINCLICITSISIC